MPTVATDFSVKKQNKKNSGKHNMSSYCFCGITQVVRRCSSSNLTQNSDMNTMFSAASTLQQYATQLPMFTWSQKMLCIGYYKEKDRELLVSNHLKCSSAYKKNKKQKRTTTWNCRRVSTRGAGSLARFCVYQVHTALARRLQLISWLKSWC